MRRAIKAPSEWLELLCQKWTIENQEIMSKVDQKFLQYKSFMKGKLSSQLLCRLSTLTNEYDPHITVDGTHSQLNRPLDFWAILGVEDEFDRNYIIAQIEKFCSLYHIRGTSANHTFLEEDSLSLADSPIEEQNHNHIGNISNTFTNGLNHHATIAGMDTTTAAAAAAAAARAALTTVDLKSSKKQQAEVHRARRKAKNAEKALETERRLSLKREHQRLQFERKSLKMRERDATNVRRAAEKAAREATREEKRRKKLQLRAQREHTAQEQKEAALRRAAELVQSNRVPIEITRGAAAASAAASEFVGSPSPTPAIEISPSKRARSSIVVSTASDLHQIVTHSKNLWTKYNAIAKEHNQKVNWITVAKELGIHVKVREKYARMHHRAEQRGFDFDACGHYKIKEHPHIFLQPLSPSAALNKRHSHSPSLQLKSLHSVERDNKPPSQSTLPDDDMIAKQQAEIEQAAAAAAAAAMKANGVVKAEELLDASVVAQIDNPGYATATTTEQVLEKTAVDTRTVQVMEGNALDQLTMKPPLNEEPSQELREEP